MALWEIFRRKPRPHQKLTKDIENPMQKALETASGVRTVRKSCLEELFARSGSCVWIGSSGTGLAGKDGRAAAAADCGYFFGCVCRAGGELVHLLLPGSRDCGDLHHGVPRVDDCYR